MLASSTISPNEYTNIKDEHEDRECANSPQVAPGSVSPKSADESHYTATSSPSSTIHTNNTNNQNGERGSNQNGQNGPNSAACSSTTSSLGQTAMESPQSSTETSQRTSFDFNSLFNNANQSLNNNNNNEKSPLFELDFQFGGSNIRNSNRRTSQNLPQQQALTNQFGGPFGAFSAMPGLDPNMIIQLSQMLGASAQNASLMQNANQQLDSALLHQQLQHASEMQKHPNLPSLFNGRGGGRFNNSTANGSPTQADPGQDKKRTYPYTFQYCVLCKKNVHSSKLPCHIRQCHVMKPMFQCPSCDFTSTYSKNNVKSHMVSLHGLAGEPISYMDQYAGQVEEFMKQCFPNVRGRGRPVHHGKGSPHSPCSPQVQQNGGGKMQNSRQSAAVRAQRQKATNLNMQVSQVPVANRLNMYAMLNGQKDEKMNLFDHLNPFAYLQNPNLMGQQQFGQCEQQQKMDIEVKKEAKKEPKNNGQISMEQLLQNISARFTSPYAQNEIKEEPIPIQADEQKTFPIFENDQEDEEISGFEPHYLSRNLKFWALSRNQIPTTIFSTFANNSNELVEKLDLSQEFEALINENANLLTKEQSDKVAEVRKELKLQDFEVAFAFHRLDLDVLPLSKLGLVASIAPTEVDIRRFTLFELSNNMRNLSEEEQFVIQLSKVERLREKLAVMRLMGTFDQTVQKLGQQLHDLSTASKLLHNSSEFHTIVQLLLICANVINGDLNSELIAGFRASSIGQLCSFKLSNGLSLLDLLASRIKQKFPELKSFTNHHGVIESAANTNFSEISNEIRRMEQAKHKVEVELNAAGSNEVLSEFLKRADAELSQLDETVQITKNQIYSTLEFFGEPTNFKNDKPVRPESFFRKIADFSQDFQNALNRI